MIETSLAPHEIVQSAVEFLSPLNSPAGEPALRALGMRGGSWTIGSFLPVLELTSIEDLRSVAAEQRTFAWLGLVSDAERRVPIAAIRLAHEEGRWIVDRLDDSRTALGISRAFQSVVRESGSGDSATATWLAVFEDLDLGLEGFVLVGDSISIVKLGWAPIEVERLPGVASLAEYLDACAAWRSRARGNARASDLSRGDSLLPGSTEEER